MKIRNFFKNYWKPITFIGLPLFIAICISIWSENIIDIKKITTFITISSWLFSFSSLLLIFLVSEKFRISTFHKNIREKNFLDQDAIAKLKDAVQKVRLFSDNQIDIDSLYDDCRDIKYIYRKLRNQKQDTELYSLKNEIGDIFDKINKHNLESIGAAKDTKKWEQIDPSQKEEIRIIAYSLEQDLKSLIKDVEERKRSANYE